MGRRGQEGRQSKEWTTALCLGQMTATPAQAKMVGKIFGLSADEQKWLQVVPYKGSLPTPCRPTR
jgi:cyanate lyase